MAHLTQKITNYAKIKAPREISRGACRG